MSVRCAGSGIYIRRSLAGSAIDMSAAFTMLVATNRRVDTNNYAGVVQLHENTADSGGRGGIFTDDTNDTLIAYKDGSGQGGPLDTGTLNAWIWCGYRWSGGLFGDNDGFSAPHGATSLTSAGGLVVSHTGTGNYFTVGAHNDGSLPYDASFCHARLWTADVSNAEILLEIASATPVRTSGLYLAWKLDDASDTSDQSGNGRAPSFTGAVATDAASPFAASGPPPLWYRPPNMLLRM